MKPKFDKNGYSSAPKNIAKAIREGIAISDEEAFGGAMTQPENKSITETLKVPLGKMGGVVNVLVEFKKPIPAKQRRTILAGLKKGMMLAAKAAVL